MGRKSKRQQKFDGPPKRNVHIQDYQPTGMPDPGPSCQAQHLPYQKQGIHSRRWSAGEFTQMSRVFRMSGSSQQELREAKLQKQDTVIDLSDDTDSSDEGNSVQKPVSGDERSDDSDIVIVDSSVSSVASPMFENEDSQVSNEQSVKRDSLSDDDIVEVDADETAGTLPSGKITRPEQEFVKDDAHDHKRERRKRRKRKRKSASQSKQKDQEELNKEKIDSHLESTDFPGNEYVRVQGKPTTSGSGKKKRKMSKPEEISAKFVQPTDISCDKVYTVTSSVDSQSESDNAKNESSLSRSDSVTLLVSLEISDENIDPSKPNEDSSPDMSKKIVPRGRRKRPVRDIDGNVLQKVSKVDGTNAEPEPSASIEQTKGEKEVVSTATDYLPKGMEVLELSESEDIILKFSEDVTVAFAGTANLECLCGQVEILGFSLTPNGVAYPVCSTRGHTLLTIVTHSDTETCDQGEVTQHLKEKLGSANQDIAKDIAENLQPSTTVILAQKLRSTACDMIQSIPRFSNLLGHRPSPTRYTSSGHSILQKVGLQLRPADSSQSFRESEDFKYVSDSFCQRISEGQVPKLMVCGGKNVGKSTLNRYVLNRALNCCGAVAYLECDVGQSEFMPSGSVSLYIVKQPLLGPPFSHQRKPYRSCFVGCLSPRDNPDHYIQCIQHLYQEYSQMEEKLPLLVNTMGWVQGMGINFMIDTYMTTLPDIVVQIDSETRTRRFPLATTEFFCSQQGWLKCKKPDVDNADFTHQHELIPVQSVVNIERLEGSSSYIRPPELRTMALLGYFSAILKPGQTAINLLAKTPYAVPWEDVAVHVCHETVPRSQVIRALNCSIVALYAVPPEDIVDTEVTGCPKFLDKMPMKTYVGLGLVRSVDAEKRMFYILTPEDPGILKTVNCLLLGELSIPKELLDLQLSLAKTTVRPVPYYDTLKCTTGSMSIRRRGTRVRRD